MQLFTTLKNKLHGLISNKDEAFESPKKASLTEALAALLALILIYILLLLIGVVLWNEVLVKLVNGINKVKSPFEILGLSILFGLIF
jgi:hypothetical protein